MRFVMISALLFLGVVSIGKATDWTPAGLAIPACHTVVLAWSCDTDVISKCWDQAQCPANSNKACWLRYEPSLNRNIVECHCCTTP